MKTSHPRLRIVLDTNVWSELATRAAGAEFDALVERAGWQVMLPPATLLEIAATGDPERRREIFATVTRRRRTMMPTEAQSEGTEVVNEIRRLRPKLDRALSSTRRPATTRGFLEI